MNALSFTRFTALIADCAAGLASRLAGSLAFAASALLESFLKVFSIERFNMLHSCSSLFTYTKGIISQI